MSLVEMTPSLAWTSKQCASFCYTQSEMSSDEVTGPWAFWPHNSAFYWQGCALLWHQEMIESGKSRFSLLGLNPWGWALEECCLFPDTFWLSVSAFKLALCELLFTIIHFLTMIFCLLESKTAILSTHYHELKWLKLLAKTKTFSFLVAFFLHFITAIERWLVQEWDLKTNSSCTNGAQEKGSRFLYLFLSTI